MADVPEHICGWALPSGRQIRTSECAACDIEKHKEMQ